MPSVFVNDYHELLIMIENLVSLLQKTSVQDKI